VVETARRELGGIDVLVNNAAYQLNHETIEEISDEEWDYTFALNVGAMFRLCREAVGVSRVDRSSTRRRSTPISRSRPCCRTRRPRAR
jgi:NAD(P)-dependent dehydrogenase (short-subunit alcohol dehydrogenase family)